MWFHAAMPVSALLPAMLVAIPNTNHTAPAANVVFTGTVTGGGVPVANAQVMIAPWGRGGLTDVNGRYRIAAPDARTGQRATISVQILGYDRASKEVTVAADSVHTDFQIETVAVELEAIVAPTSANRIAAAPAPSGALRMGAGGGIRIRARAADTLLRGDPDFNTENYAAIEENEFLAPRAHPLSTFSIDVDRASYANVRRFLLREQRMPPKDAVRIEELVNYFTYDDPAPENGSPLAVRTELAPAPWKPAHKLLRIGIKARDIPSIEAPPGNFVFLIDVSGSMTPPDKLPLLKQAFSLLVNELRRIDRVAIVVYASASGLVLESTPGDRKEEILEAMGRLEAGGSTAGGAGIRLAYDVARANYIPGGNNRVILATDGDFNVGASSDAEMMRLIEEKREQGTFLSVLGFGTGNIKDSKMEILADKGNGNYAYIDGIAEARKVLVHELGGTLVTVAKDVKIQVEFDPTLVAGYRLIGYENRLLAAEDFNDDRKDAGELGAGHSVTALYEIVPVGVESDVVIRTPDSLRYQTPPARASNDRGEIAFVKVRYKQPDGETSALLEHVVQARDTGMSTDLAFSAAVAAFGMVLRDSQHKGDASLDRVLALARGGLGEDEGGYRAGFLELVEAARAVSMIATAEDSR